MPISEIALLSETGNSLWVQLVLPETVNVARDDALAHALTWSLCAEKTYVTLTVKVSLRLGADHRLSLDAPAPVVTRDVHAENDSEKPLEATLESAPYLTEAAFLVYGHAHPPKSAPKDPFLARLGVSRQTVLIDKTLRVRSPAGTPVLLTYQNAARDRQNPGGRLEPLITDPRNPLIASGFGPLGPHHEARAQYVKGAPPVFSEVLDLGREFDSRHWNPAPQGQRLPFFQGGESVVIEGLDANEKRSAFDVPHLRIDAQCRIDEAPVRPISMSADMLSVNMDTRAVSFIWRAIVLVPPATKKIAFSARLTGEALPKVEKPLPPTPKPSRPQVSDPGRELLLTRIDERASLHGLDLIGADLHGMDLRGLDLTNCKLDRARLDDTNLKGSTLTGASLSGASFEESTCDGADFSRTNLTDAKLGQGSFKKASFVEANLTRAVLDDAKLEGANLASARLLGARLTRAHLDEADLSGADLSKASLRSARLVKAILSRANLTQVDGEKARFDNAKIDQATLLGAQLIEARFDGADASRSSFAGACAVRASFIGCNLQSASFEKASIDEARLDDANLLHANLKHCAGPGARFAGAKLEEANLQHAVFSGAAFSSANLTRADLREAALEKALFDNANLTSADLRNTKLAHAKLNGANILSSDFRDSDLTSATLTGCDRENANLEGAKLLNVIE